MATKVRLLLVALLALVPLATVTSARAADPAPTTVRVSADRASYTAGTTAVVTITVTNGHNQDLSLRIEGSDGSVHQGVIASGVNDTTLTEKLFTSINTTFRATVGTGGSAVSAAAVLRVRPAMATAPAGKYGWSGRYAVYPHGSRPRFTSQSFPSRPGRMCLRHQVQRLRAGAWRAVTTSGCRSENTDGKVSWRWTGTHPSGVRFRVRAAFGGDAQNLRGTGKWLYFRLR